MPSMTLMENTQAIQFFERFYADISTDEMISLWPFHATSFLGLTVQASFICNQLIVSSIESDVRYN